MVSLLHCYSRQHSAIDFHSNSWSSCFLIRLWFVYNADGGSSALQSSVPTEIGYMNVIPKCINSLSKYPHYENLPETYVAINDYLLESPLEGLPTTPW